MDFFQSQEKARKQTGRLVLMYCVAVLLIILAVYVAAVTILLQTEATGAGSTLWYPPLFLGISTITLALVVGGTLWKIAQLAGGGAAVAKAMGGTLVNPETQDLHERRLVNIIEEMALASGTPVPEVYLLDDEEGINAFAAGYSPKDAAVGVTRGCTQRLSRDELQGVIAHEFSHILNGDMRLNIRLIGVLNGILIIYMVGYTLMRMSGGYGYRRSRSDGKGNGGGVILFGLALVAIGGLGAFFANLIKSAVSRQREFLADASAVQFTRNPDGISGALKKIGGFTKGSTIANPKAEEISHMFFANGVSSLFGSLFATHPPLTERIKRIDPTFNGVLPELSEVYDQDPAQESSSSLVSGAGVSHDIYQIKPERVTAQIGNPSQATLQLAKDLLSTLPDGIREKSHNPVSAAAILFCLLISKNEKVRAVQFEHLKASALPGVFAEVQQIYRDVGALNEEYRLPLLDISIPALRKLTAEEFEKLSENIVTLVQADGEITLFEFVLVRIVTQSLQSQFNGEIKPEVNYFKVNEIRPELELILSALAHFGNAEQTLALDAFNSGAKEFKDLRVSFIAKESCSLESLNFALNKMNQSAPLLKKGIISACVRCAAKDGKATLAEVELLRAISESLECPLPPFV